MSKNAFGPAGLYSLLTPLAILAALWLALAAPSTGWAGPAEERAAYEEGVRLFRAEKKVAEAAETLSGFLRMYPDSRWADAAALELARIRLAQRQPAEAAAILGQVLEKRPDTPLKGEVLIELGRAALARGDRREAAQLLQSARAGGLTPVLASEAERLQAEIDRPTSTLGTPGHPGSLAEAEASALADSARGTRLGAVLPLTGRYRAFGERALAGILAALDLAPGAARSSGWTLLLEDSAGDPERAAQAVHDLASRDRVLAVVGPLLVKESLAAAEAAHQEGIPLISLSPDPRVPGAFPSTFRRALPEEAQVKAVAGHALEAGFSSFAILAPATPYGERMRDLFRAEVEKTADDGKPLGKVVKSESFAPGSKDFGPALRALGNLDRPLTAQEKAVLARDKKWKLAPRIEFEALFVPADYAAMGLIAPQLAYYDLTGILLLGLDSWNSPWLAELGEQWVEGAVFAASFDPSRADSVTRSFVDGYTLAYFEEPSPLAAQAFDAARAVRAGAEAGFTDPSSLRSYLSSLRGFPGAGGAIDSDGKGDLASPPLLLTVRNGSFAPATAPLRPSWALSGLPFRPLPPLPPPPPKR